MPLTEPACKNATCPSEKTRARYSDSGGLYLEVGPTGSKRWFWKYYLPGGKEKRLALGAYPEVSLKAARGARDDARKIQQGGTDPAEQRRTEKLARQHSPTDSFEAVARELHASKRVGWSAQYAARWIERMEKDLFPWIGTMPLPKITAPLLLQVLRRVEARGARETSHTLRQTAGQVFRHGIATGRGERNPAGDLQGALQPVTVKHMAAVLDEHAAGHLMRAIHAYQGQPTTRGALLLSALTFQRPANVRMMEWSEIDTDERMWAIPAAKMKRRQDGKINGRPHFVPLAQQALEALEELRPITGHGRYVFPGLHDHERPMSENTVNLALRRMGFSAEEMTAHGFRSMARTIMVERTGVPADVIEAQLAHGKSGPLGSAYDRADFMAQRREMMTTWAEYLARIRIGAQVLPLKKA
ncbi:tyrosine-type recombinase/integrase [Ideonella sp.]|jgi:integrase|uniref:tyrosine-type recombinase/integrase n=1 Tax=Ideonella sp. TaxID=1929293 RepID=UPI0037BE306A